MQAQDDEGNPVETADFQYPNEDSPTVVEDTNIRRLLDWMVYYVLTSRNPTASLIATTYAAGYDIGGIYGVPNTIRSIAKATGIVHVNLSKEVKRVAQELSMSLRIVNGR
jgi:transcription initiation factor TFIIIB Brf1 subunit/transcription initiation factor TFIIB